MEQLLETLQADALLFGLMLVRVSAMFASAPVIGSNAVPVRVRVGLAVVVTLSSVAMVAGDGPRVPDDVWGYAALAVKELVIGVAIGLVAQMLFAAVQMAGSFIDTTTGFAMAQMIDPVNNGNVTVLGRAYSLIATTLWVAMGGHLLLMQGIVASFVLLPPTEQPNLAAVVEGVMMRADDLFIISLQIAAPLMAALVITDVALGIMSRAAPQMNVFMVGMPLKVGVALLGTALLLPTFATYFEGVSTTMIEDLSTILRAAGAG
jgi:flagellar biosynthetic protein FliR